MIAPAGEIGERAASDVDRRRSKPDSAVVRIGVVADAERDLAELGEMIVVEDYRVAAATCTAAGCWRHLLRIASNGRQPQLQSRIGSAG